MTLTELYHFLQGFRDLKTLGAVLPTSASATRLITRECRRRQTPQRILEVGAGIGTVSLRLARRLGPQDTLTLCELNPRFAAFLRQRIAEEAPFRELGARLSLFEGSVLDMPAERQFDQIVSFLPFNNMTAPLVGQIFEHFRGLLAPGGSLAFLEYGGVRTLRRTCARGEAARNIQAIHDLLEEQLSQRSYREPLAFNVPPGWARFLRFDDPTPEEARALKPLDDRHRMRLAGRWGVASDAVAFLAAMAPLSLWLHRSGRPGWALPLALAAGVGLFLRDPQRQVPTDPDLLLSACDGRVMKVERLRDPHLGDREWLRISTFLSIADVHINRAPAAGVVAAQFLVSGGAAPAMLPQAEANHSCYTVLDTVRGPVVVAQRVGLIARRISNWVREGESLAQGERYGLIRMGSRTDVYLPSEAAEPLVGPGDRLAGGLTPVARYTDARPRS